jgi:hypothetical protein
MTYADIHGFIYYPKDHTLNFKVMVEHNGVVVDYTDYVISCEYTSVVTDEIGNCKVTFDNGDGEITDTFYLNDIIYIYFDLTDATTLKFKGYIEKPKKVFKEAVNSLEVTGRHLSSELLDLTVTEEFTNTEVSAILISLIAEYLSGYTSTNVATVGTTASVKWSNKPFWECVQDICGMVNYDCYVDNDKDFHFFAKGSIICATEAVVEDQNMIEISNLSDDVSDVKNEVVVYGEDDEGLPVIYTSSDSSSQTSYGFKEKIVKDTDISTSTYAQNVADGEIELAKEPNTKGDIQSFTLIDLNQGDKLWIASPSHEIHASYRISKFTHDVIEGNTFCTVEREQKIPDVFKQRFEKEMQTEKIINKYRMKYSYNFTFDGYADVDVAKCSNITISNGMLYLTSTASSGTFISNAKTAAENATSCELKVKAQDMGASTY